MQHSTNTLRRLDMGMASTPRAQSNCDAHAECGQFADPPGKTCSPIACCSEHGYCGTSEEFCNGKCQGSVPCVPHPAPSGSKNTDNVYKRVVGYYEAWAARRSCQAWKPTDLPVDGLTHLNFAFAYIEPESYELATMDDATPAELFSETTDVKNLRTRDEALNVFISVGGWKFSDNNTKNQPLFGEIARDTDKCQKFAHNVVKFMDQYGFDGLDIDWEYPGASDRGGQPDDTKNFVQLVRILRETFYKQSRPLGLTFTIPTSYWYLRWFALPGMLPHVDWINVMSYDLHGYWDRENIIGNVVLPHTNITEIKLAMELLWRVDIPPDKVVLGVGFYGRTYELADSDCAESGCPFGGPAKPGPCTNSSGTLSYSEINDILNDSSGSEAGTHSKRQIQKPLYDPDGCFNYFRYGNQYVSYDDPRSLRCKIKFGQDNGLLGSMIWPLDDDTRTYELISRTPQRDDYGRCRRSQQWEAGGTALSCPSGYHWIGSDKGGDCGKGRAQNICCPAAAYPSSECTWRGDGTECNGQCHAGEITLATSKKGGLPKQEGTTDCVHGEKVFCCVANHWDALIGKCFDFGCGKECDEGYESIVTKHDRTTCQCNVGGSCSQEVNVCCPKPAKFKGCHCVGQSDCADNSCDNNDIVFARDHYGDGKHGCSYGRQKTCCCNMPDEQAFLPFELEDIFPTLPPVDNDVKMSVVTLDQTAASDISEARGFGLVVIDGPQSAVASGKSKRDGSPSDLIFIDCDHLRSEGMQTLRYVCAADDIATSDCNNFMKGGVEGTILELPDDCGPAPYVVLHNLERATNQTLPGRLSTLSNKTVSQLSFHYDFSLAKRDSGDIYFRVDYANCDAYWGAAVARFYSTDPKHWDQTFTDWIKTCGTAGTSFTQDLDQTIFAGVAPCDDEDAYAEVRSRGRIDATPQFAITIVGTISPVLDIEEVNAYMSTSFEADAYFDFALRGDLNLEHIEGPLFPPLTSDIFRHPGVITIEPTFQVDVLLEADTEVTGNFTTGVHASSSERMVGAWPKAVEDGSAKLQQEAQSEKFSGLVASVGRSGNLTVGLRPVVGLNITINKFGTDGKLLNAFIDGSFSTYNDRLSPVDLIRELAGKQISNEGPKLKIVPEEAVLNGGKGVVACLKRKRECEDEDECMHAICLDAGSCDDLDYAGQINDPDDEGIDLESSRAKREPFRVEFEDGTSLVIQSRSYPSIGKLYSGKLGTNVYADSFDYSDDLDCGNTKVKHFPAKAAEPYVTEHIIELQTIGAFLEAAQSGRFRTWDKFLDNAMRIPSKFFIDQWLKPNLPPFLPPVVPRGPLPKAPYDSKVPNDRVFEALGSSYNRENFVACRDEINSVKARIWDGVAPASQVKFEKAINEWIQNCGPSAAFLKYLKAIASVFEYLTSPEVSQRLRNEIADKTIPDHGRIRQQVDQRRHCICSSSISEFHQETAELADRQGQFGQAGICRQQSAQNQVSLNVDRSDQCEARLYLFFKDLGDCDVVDIRSTRLDLFESNGPACSTAHVNAISCNPRTQMDPNSRTKVHRLSPSSATFPLQASKFAALRLFALEESPNALSSTYEIESKFSPHDWQSRLARPEINTFVAVDLTDDGTSWEEAGWIGKVTLLGPVEKEEFEISDVQGLGSGTESRWQMNALYVHPSARGRGVAKVLITAAIAFAQREGPARVRIMIKRDHQEVRGLYEGIGFVDVGRCTLGEALRANGDGS
ncbi:glycoside hydrolase family 18 protein [Zasmidium cellare ATCC 36951]|uniref:chitinase n=1 Tax=Zasmidium cellare ATCC 36951 TaxID=1080233 RepID=A0A6A6CJJ3_ZASCE|nr:glycoside hydrolase family 18 protein [Zasmidium cellare ATCC 36951]KAF2166320.1 glycoside hydrolase family 18 protein [Zasmidium cellare ATCC 36951]